MLTNSDISEHGRPVAVFGAAGHTGRFVVAELLRRGFAPIAIGRDIARLKGSGLHERHVSIRSASIDDPASLDRALQPMLPQSSTAPALFKTRPKPWRQRLCEPASTI